MKSMTLKRREEWNSIYQLRSIDAHSYLPEWKAIFKKLMHRLMEIQSDRVAERTKAFVGGKLNSPKA